MRIVLSFFLTAAIMLAVYHVEGDWWSAIAVAVAGIGAVLVMMAGGKPIAVSAVVTEPTVDGSESGLLDAIDEPILLVADGRVRLANPAARALLGAHIIGEDVRLAIRHPAAAERLAVGADDGTVELAGIGTREQRHDMHVATTGRGRKLIHLADRTARHDVERARVDFVANASHELRTPLSAILGFVETLKDDNAGGDPATRGRFLTVIDNEARRMQRLIDDLISLSRIEAEKHELPHARVDLAALVRKVAAEIGDASRESAARFSLELADDMPAIVGEEAQLSQVLHNLAGNAIKYGRAGTPVIIALREDGRYTRLSVTDQGDGIPAEHLPRLTERFYRVDAGRSRGLGGTGLGLAIVKHIVERHRGKLEIASVVGTGTTVNVLIPAASVTQTSPN